MMPPDSSPQDRLSSGSSRARSSANSAMMELFQRHQELMAAADACPVEEAAEMQRLFWNETDAIELEMMATRCQNAADLAAKIIALTFDGRSQLPAPSDAPDLWAELRKLVGRGT